MNDSDYVQYGCGRCAPANWRNFDSSMTLRYERVPLMGKVYKKNEDRFPKNVEYGDIVKGLPVADNSCKVVYCSHVIEHLSLNEARQAIRNTYRILKSGGTFRFVLPDLEFYVHQYNEDGSPDAAMNFMQGTLLGIEQRPKTLKGVLYQWLRTSAHFWMWDYKALERELQEAGFVDIRRAQFGDSEDDHFQEVEAENRWENCLGIDCKKP